MNSELKNIIETVLNNVTLRNLRSIPQEILTAWALSLNLKYGSRPVIGVTEVNFASKTSFRVETVVTHAMDSTPLFVCSLQYYLPSLKSYLKSLI